MTDARLKFLSAKFNGFLDRFSPPHRLTNNLTAQQTDADDLLSIIVRHAPDDGYEAWLHKVLQTISGEMKSRWWPAPGEVKGACDHVTRNAYGNSQTTERQTVDQMVVWFRKNKSQMPGSGRPDRTAEMIRRGVFTNAREARFWGFDLSDEVSQMAKSQPMSTEEAERHHRVMKSFKLKSEHQTSQNLESRNRHEVNMLGDCAI